MNKCQFFHDFQLVWVSEGVCDSLEGFSVQTDGRRKAKPNETDRPRVGRDLLGQISSTYPVPVLSIPDSRCRLRASTPSHGCEPPHPHTGRQSPAHEKSDIRWECREKRLDEVMAGRREEWYSCCCRGWADREDGDALTKTEIKKWEDMVDGEIDR